MAGARATVSASVDFKVSIATDFARCNGRTTDNRAYWNTASTFGHCGTDYYDCICKCISSLPSPPSVPPAPGSTYCGDATCGDALLRAGWQVLSEWGTVNRFNESLLVDSHDDFLSKGWSVPTNDGLVQANYFNYNGFDTDPQVTQWFALLSPNAAYEHDIPVGTTSVVVAFAGGTSIGYRCTMSIYDKSGTEVYTRTRQGEGFSPFPDPDVVAVDTTAGPARIRFEEPGVDICWTAYVLYYTPSPPSPPPPSQPPPLPPPLPPPPSPPPPYPPGGLYCGDSTCGAALKSDGWKVLSEWGSVDRFGESILIDSHADFLSKGWFVPDDGSVAANQFNYDDGYDTNPQVTSWWKSGNPRAAYEHHLPSARPASWSPSPAPP